VAAVRLIGSAVAALWLLQAVAGGFAHLLYDWRFLAIPVSLLYLLLAGAAALWLGSRYQTRGGAALAALVTGLLWQLPVVLGAVNQVRELLGLTEYDGNSDLLDFAMQTWQTALMPLLGLLPGRGAQVLAGYYIGLVLSPAFLLLGFAVLAALGVQRRQAQVQVLRRFSMKER
jgi:hypothetical protein